VREIGEAIIGNLDDDGYLVASVDEIAAMGDWPVDDVERALALIQGFDPIGVAARDLQECLTAAAAPPRARGHAGRDDRHRAPAAAAEPPGAGDRQALGMSIEELKQHIEIIRTSIRSRAAATTRRSRSTSSPTSTS
jgi:RNA polymerase sigma-54 factor